MNFKNHLIIEYIYLSLVWFTKWNIQFFKSKTVFDIDKFCSYEYENSKFYQSSLLLNLFFIKSQIR